MLELGNQVKMCSYVSKVGSNALDEEVYRFEWVN
jgi:hypothetical protein